MRTKSFRIILLVGIITFIIWAVLNIAQHEWLGWGIGFGVVILIYLFYSSKKTELMIGVINRMVCSEKKRPRALGPEAGIPLLKERYFEYFIEVNGISLEIHRDTWDRLSEGDEVCVSYWPKSMTVTGVDITKKVDPNTAKQIAEVKRKEAMESFRRRYKEK